MRFGSVCSGMEAASLAWHPLGWECAFVSEIEKAPCALLKERYPDVPNFGDMTKFEEWPDVAIDLLAGGTPCQAFSVAGLRRGLTDPRGSLMLTYGAIAQRYRPTWLFWENVPGVLSSDGGRDFGAFLGMLAELGYGFAYRVLDAQFFGLAQRRARVFVVGYLGDWRPPAAVLFERESLRGDSAPRRQAGEGIAPTIAARTKGGGGLGTDAECDGALIPEIARTLLGKDNSSHAEDQDTYIAHTLNAKGGSDRSDGESETFIAHSLRADGFDASEDGTGRGTPLIAFSSKDHGADAGELAPTLRAMGHDGSHANAGGQAAIAYTLHGADKTVSTATPTDIAGSIRTKPPGSIENSSTTIVTQPYTLAIRGRGDGHDLEYRQDGVANAVLTPNGGRAGIGVGAIAEQWAVRRLTPRECERLQGAPDDHTLITYRGKPMADGPRYKMIGNSWAVPVVRWIGERIVLVSNDIKAVITDERKST